MHTRSPARPAAHATRTPDVASSRGRSGARNLSAPLRAEPHRSSRCGTEMTRNAKLLETAFKERGALRVLKSARARHHSAGIHCWPRIVVSTTSGAAPFSRIAQIAVTSPLCSFGGSAHASRSETSLASRMKRRLP